MNLSPNFTLSEFTSSQTAARRGIDNRPPADVIEHLAELAAVLERIRAEVGKPIVINSGYRSFELNEAVGGAANSAHLSGWAADITIPGFGSPLQVCRTISQIRGLRFDQIILEFADSGGGWCHLSIDPRYRMQVLTIDRQGTRSGLS